ncbi:MAG: hypothetical protein SFT94_00895 [Pseudanabaenaceae cyanobacterium bins.68]|nr:hypothetical protein [Pseudanabaenaceae cyanobacterium bins.68]
MAEAKAREINGLLLADAFRWEAYITHEQEEVEVVKKWGEIVIALLGFC